MSITYTKVFVKLEGALTFDENIGDLFLSRYSSQVLEWMICLSSSHRGIIYHMIKSSFKSVNKQV